MMNRNGISITALFAWLFLSTLAGPAGAQDVDLSNARSVTLEEPFSAIMNKGGGAMAFKVRVPIAGIVRFTANPSSREKVRARFVDQEGKTIGETAIVMKSPGEAFLTIEPLEQRWSKDEAADGVYVVGEIDVMDPGIDTFEPNDSQTDAAAFTLGPETPVAGGFVMLFPKNDQDWFTIKLARDGYIVPRFFAPQGTSWENRFPGLRTADNKGLRWGQPFRMKAGKLTLGLTGGTDDPVPAQLEFRYVPDWDACEPNDRQQDACHLTEGAPVDVSLYPSGGDRDWYRLQVPGEGYIVLSIDGLPKQERQGRRITRGLDLRVQAFRQTEDNKRSRRPVTVTHGTVIIPADGAGTYYIQTSGTWIDAAPVRALKLTAKYAKQLSSKDEADTAIIGVYGRGRKDENLGLDLAVMSALGDGAYKSAQSAEDIEKAIGEVVALNEEPASEKKDAKDAEDARASEAKTVKEKLEARKQKHQQEKKQEAKANPELARLQALQDYLEASSDNFLYRHHYKAKDGSILKRLEKDKAPALGESQYDHQKAQKLSPVLSQRYLTRAIQEAE